MNTRAQEHKAQGTIEYLVIIAIVVVIALVVVGLLLQVMNQGSNIPETSAKTAWKSTEPWGIVDWSRATDGNLTLVLKNNTADTLEFNEFAIGSSSADKNSNPATVPAYATKVIVITTSATCASGTKYSYSKTDIYIDYNSTSINGKRMGGAGDIVGTC
ncbi:MAG: hypothetical protein WCW44_01470 [archaeon]|jgi:hypothetical protein